jgi:hypothetical protein
MGAGCQAKLAPLIVEAIKQLFTPRIIPCGLDRQVWLTVTVLPMLHVKMALKISSCSNTMPDLFDELISKETPCASSGTENKMAGELIQ